MEMSGVKRPQDRPGAKSLEVARGWQTTFGTSEEVLPEIKMCLKSVMQLLEPQTRSTSSLGVSEEESAGHGDDLSASRICILYLSSLFAATRLPLPWVNGGGRYLKFLFVE